VETAVAMTDGKWQMGILTPEHFKFEISNFKGEKRRRGKQWKLSAASSSHGKLVHRFHVKPITGKGKSGTPGTGFT
jgi:hypothetical protein